MLATITSLAAAQGVEVTHDSTDTTHAGTVQQRQGRNWFVSLLHKIARRSDDSITTASLAAPVAADTDAVEPADSATGEVPLRTRRATRSFKSRRDSIEWRAARNVAARSTGYRIVVDLFQRELYVLDRDDTLRVAPAATAMNATLSYGGRTWRFETPRGVRTVRTPRGVSKRHVRPPYESVAFIAVAAGATRSVSVRSST